MGFKFQPVALRHGVSIGVTAQAQRVQGIMQLIEHSDDSSPPLSPVPDLYPNSWVWVGCVQVDPVNPNLCFLKARA
jgi:hypothetical protein